MTNQKAYTLRELTQGLDVTIQGDADCVITGIAPIQLSQTGHITFLTNSLYRKYLADTKASAVILSADDAASCSVQAVISRNPYFVYAKIASYFESPQMKQAGIHPSVVIGRDCQIDPSASIGPYSVIGDRVKIGANTCIASNCTLGDDCEVGEEGYIADHVVIYHHTKMGKRIRLAAGVVIGSDGFGFANNQGAWHKVPQLGGVSIGDDVDIGANTTIDRGALEDTVIGNGVKLDNLIQVGHNVQIGDHTIIAGCTGIAGSTVIGKHCMVGGATCFNGHINVCDHAIFTGMSTVTKSVTEPGIYSSGIVGVLPNLEFRKSNARFYRLENLFQRVKNCELSLKTLLKKDKKRA